MADFRKQVRLGDTLIQAGKITEDQLKTALTEQKKKNTKLGQIIVDLGYMTRDELDDELCKIIGVSKVNILNAKIDEKAVRLINADEARRLRVLPYKFDENDPRTLYVAMDDPLDIMALDDVEIITNCRVIPVLSHYADISRKIDAYLSRGKAEAAANQYKEEQKIYEDITANAHNDANNEELEKSPIVAIVRNTIETAARQRASDIHIEPFEYEIRVRYRIDGVLVESMTYDMALYNALIARIKIISGMDISEKRKPQDGRITIEIEGQEYDIRVSCLPTCYGEKVVMRLALKAGFQRNKSDLGLKPEDLVKFDNILKNPHGIILVTGPTGSGKSTTLYTALSELNKPEVNIITVEDPVEANIDGINQVMVNAKADLTFSSALRSILRQDPDIIMIGEIRDSETAEIAVKASITGHLVVSTLHTNSTAASIARLVDMGIEPYLLSDSLVGIIAQRLVRRLCNECKDEVEATREEKLALGVNPDSPLKIYEPHMVRDDMGNIVECGCPKCNNLGYHGRIGVYEIMPITRTIRTMIAKKKNADEIMDAAVGEGMSTLRKSAGALVLDGTTSFNEMVKITYNVEN